MVSDPTLKFDHRTPVDLKQKYRYMLKKGLIQGPPSESTPLRHKQMNHDQSDSVDESQGLVSANHQVPSPAVLPTVKQIIKRSEGWGCLMSMEEVGERLVPMEDIPANLLPAFLAYKRYLKAQLKLTRETVLMLSVKEPRASGGGWRTKRTSGKAPDNADVDKIKAQPNQRAAEHDHNTDDERHSAGRNGEESLNPGPLDRINPVPLQILEQETPEEEIRGQQEHIRAKRTRLVSKMREVRQSPHGKSCLVQ